MIPAVFLFFYWLKVTPSCGLAQNICLAYLSNLLLDSKKITSIFFLLDLLKSNTETQKRGIKCSDNSTEEDIANILRYNLMNVTILEMQREIEKVGILFFSRKVFI